MSSTSHPVRKTIGPQLRRWFSRPSFELTGGPDGKTVQLPSLDFGGALLPHLAGSPRAVELYLERSQAERRTRALATAGFFVTLWAIFVIDRTSTGEVWVDHLRGLLPATITLVCIAPWLVIANRKSPWAEMLRAYNRDHPEHPWYAEHLGVEPPSSSRLDAGDAVTEA